jgi:hypothetical protein
LLTIRAKPFRRKRFHVDRGARSNLFRGSSPPAAGLLLGEPRVRTEN